MTYSMKSFTPNNIVIFNCPFSFSDNFYFVLFVEGETIVSNSSCYTVRKPTNSNTWEDSKKLCEGTGSALVSIETKEELNYLQKQLIEKRLQHEYFIGLRNVTGKWKWISNSSLKYEIDKRSLPSTPNNIDDCVKMYFPTECNGCTAVFDDIKCTTEKTNRGYICERPVPCQDTKGLGKREICI